MRSSRAFVPLLVIAGLGIAGLAGTTAVELRERARLRRELVAVRQEIRIRLGHAERHRERVVVRAPFATWAHLVAGLHEAAAASGLDRFRYATLGVVALTDPDAPVPADGASDAPAPTDADASGGSRTGKDSRAPAPYRAMRARVEGGGEYGQIVSFVRALASVDPPLQLDRIVVRAGEDGPTFEALVHLVTALPVEAPRVVALDRVPTGGLPPALGEALVGLAPPVPAPATEVQR